VSRDIRRLRCGLVVVWHMLLVADVRPACQHWHCTDGDGLGGIGAGINVNV
jgi:hypothetical protein